jgi:hypothetical protein
VWVLKRITLSDINEQIDKNRKYANLSIKLSTQSIGRRKKSRARSVGEQVALTQIAIAQWKKAESLGKIKRQGDRVIYYDYR